jgi:hypothetical protein
MYVSTIPANLWEGGISPPLPTSKPNKMADADHLATQPSPPPNLAQTHTKQMAQWLAAIEPALFKDIRLQQ